MANTLVCAADELCVGDIIDAPGLERHPLTDVTLVGGQQRQPCFMVRIVWQGADFPVLLLPSLRIAVYPSREHVAWFYSLQAAAAVGLPHNRKERT